MDWAHDHLGNDVPAWRGGISAYGLRCPSCGEPVRRRAGRERAAHFAHFSHRAKPDCENYFPANASGAIALVPGGGSAPFKGLGREFLTCFLFLAHEERHDSLELWLRVPPLRSATGTGALEIQTGVGTHLYRAADLSVARLVPLAPQTPLAGCSGTGDLLAFAAHVAGQLVAFTSAKNFFYAGERGGRLVFNDEPLEWGARYWLLTKEATELPSDLTTTLGWRSGPKLNEWNTFEVTLPAVVAASRPQLPDQIFAFLGRRIRGSRPRLFISDPPPHHVEIDGTHVYAASPASVLVRRTGTGKVTCETIGGESRVTVTETSHDWLRLSGLPLDGEECAICIDGRPQMVLRAEDCELFRPPGILVSLDGASWDLCTSPTVSSKDLLDAEVTIDCSSERVASHVARLNSDLQQQGTVLRAAPSTVKAIYAGSFGELQRIVASLVDGSKPVGIAPELSHLRANRVWIEGLLASRLGGDSVVRVRRYLDFPSSSNLFGLGDVLLSPLMPYIRVLETQEHKRRRKRE